MQKMRSKIVFNLCDTNFIFFKREFTILSGKSNNSNQFIEANLSSQKHVFTIRRALLSISSTLNVQFFCTNFSPKPKRNQKKLPKQRSYEKFVRKTLMKLTPGVNFTNMFTFSFCTHRSQDCKKDTDDLTVFLHF